MAESTSVVVSDKVKSLALDLLATYPRSPRAKLGGYVVAARAVDKCRAVLAGTAGEYHYDCPLDNMFFGFAEIKGDDLKAFVATGADDEAVAAWIKEHAKAREEIDVIKWNNKMREMTLGELPDGPQAYMETYIEEFVPPGKVVYRWFDVYDYEEKRL